MHLGRILSSECGGVEFMTADLPGRMLRLLSFLQMRREWSGTELADRLGVTGRTVRRDIERLRSLGYPVDGTAGRAGGYRLASGAAMPPLILDDDEAMAVAVALRTASGGLVGIDEAALRALAKLEHVLPARLRHQVAAIQATSVINWEGPAAHIDPDVLRTLALGCRDRETVRFDYTARDGTSSSRRTEPHRIVSYGGLWFLLAYDTDKDDWRIFRLDRITRPTPTCLRFVARPIPGSDPAAFVADRIAAAPVRYHARATVGAPAATVRRRTGALPARVTPMGANTSVVDCSSNDLIGIAHALIALDTEYELDADEHVAAYLARVAERLRPSSQPGGGARTPQPRDRNRRRLR